MTQKQLLTNLSLPLFINTNNNFVIFGKPHTEATQYIAILSENRKEFDDRVVNYLCSPDFLCY